MTGLKLSSTELDAALRRDRAQAFQDQLDQLVNIRLLNIDIRRTAVHLYKREQIV